MKRLNLRQFVIRYSSLLVVAFAFLLISQNWEILAKGYYQKPILLRGLGGLTLSVLSVELVVLFSASLVIGIGATFMMWMFYQTRTD
ncbi:hypothetical protein [Spirosoma aerophilum]